MKWVSIVLKYLYASHLHQTKQMGGYIYHTSARKNRIV